MRWVVIAVAAVLLAGIAAGHVPRTVEGGVTMEEALQVHDPQVSQVFYGGIEGSPDFYRVELEQGAALDVSLFVPRPTASAPDLAVIGPGLNGTGRLPDAAEVPAGSGRLVRLGTVGAAEYEPFTPSYQYRVAEAEMQVEGGTYYLVVFGGSGPYGLTVGSLERFTPAEWVRTPVDVLLVHLWEGQSPLVVFGPFLLVLAAGGWLLRDREWTLREVLGVGGGLLGLGSALATLAQLAIAGAVTGPVAAMAVTLALAALQAAAGGAAVALGLRGRRWALVAAGAAGLAVWAGAVLGPLLMIAAGLLPERWDREL